MLSGGVFLALADEEELLPHALTKVAIKNMPKTKFMRDFIKNS